MISGEQRARIRRLFYAEHWRVGTIATQLGIHRETVMLAIEAERFQTRAGVVYPSQLDPYKAFIVEQLEQYPKLRATRIFAMVRARGYAGGEVVVRRYVRTVRPTPKNEAYFHLATLPGEQGQVDWASFGKVRIGAAHRQLSCFVMVLSHSRAMYARFALDQTLESFLRAHVEAFRALGGVPRVLLYDNLKSVVLERSGEHVRYHPRILELAGHYHFDPQPCAPGRGNEKGKVERTIQYLRHSFFAARRYSSIADLNRQLLEWIGQLAHQRLMPGDPDKTPIHIALLREQPVLLPLPSHDFECDLVVPIRSGKQPYLRFDSNDYTIPADLVRKPLTLVASEAVIRVLDGTVEVARHTRSYDRGQKIEQPEHLRDLAERKRAAREVRGRDRLRCACTHADSFLRVIAQRGDPVGHHTVRLLKLLERYGADELDAALVEALSRGAVSAESAAHICDQRTRARHRAPPVLIEHSDPRVTQLHVTPHQLSPYDALSTTRTLRKGRHDPD
jgi:transposase